jgi:hypothetical protein
MSKIDWAATKKKDVEIHTFLTGRIDHLVAKNKPELAKHYEITLDALMEVWAERYNMPFILVIADVMMDDIKERLGA